jgi:hypothetical protein
MLHRFTILGAHPDEESAGASKRNITAHQNTCWSMDGSEIFWGISATALRSFSSARRCPICAVDGRKTAFRLRRHAGRKGARLQDTRAKVHSRALGLGRTAHLEHNNIWQLRVRHGKDVAPAHFDIGQKEHRNRDHIAVRVFNHEL